MPHLALLARLYHGVKATSCQSERNFSALSFVIAHLRSSMAPFKVEQMMFVRLNQDYIPEFRRYKAVVGSQKERMKKCGREVQSMQLKTAGETIEIDLRLGERAKSFIHKNDIIAQYVNDYYKNSASNY